MSLTKIGSIGINTGIQFAGVTTVSTLHVGSGVTLSSDGDVFATGISTFSEDIKVGSGVTISPDGDIFATGVCTATSFVGDGANLTNVDVVSDTSPQLGGNLETNDKNIVFGDSSGATVNRLALGAGTDFSIYHNGTNTILDNNTGNLQIDTTANEVHNVQSEFQVKVKGGDEDGLKVITDGAVELYHDNSKKFQTYGSGIQFFGNIKNETDGTNQGLFLGAANDFQFYHDGNRSAVNNRTGDLRLLGAGDVRIGRADSGNQTSYDELYAAFISNGAVELYHNNSKKLETASYGFITQGTGEVDVVIGSTNAGGAFLVLDGDSNGDASGSDYASIGHNTAGILDIHARNPAGNAEIQFRTQGTHRASIDSSGHLTPATNNTYDLGTSSLRWRNIYTNDLNLSNKGSTNSVDNTWGDYTIQEGESDLFLINNRSGKKYKFNLTEVS